MPTKNNPTDDVDEDEREDILAPLPPPTRFARYSSGARAPLAMVESVDTTTELVEGVLEGNGDGAGRHKGYHKPLDLDNLPPDMERWSDRIAALLDTPPELPPMTAESRKNPFKTNKNTKPAPDKKSSKSNGGNKPNFFAAFFRHHET